MAKTCDQSSVVRRAANMKRACVTGGAGFIGSNLVDHLAVAGVEVVVVDDFRTGRREFLNDAMARPNVRLVEDDVLDRAAMEEAVDGCDWVFHLQANADVRDGLRHPTRDLEQNTLATSNVLEAMRACQVKQIAFASTGSVYGEPDVFPTPEDAPFPVQTSLYAASKLACEGLIEAYAVGYGFTGVICRFVSILGERYTHGHVVDFHRSLKRDPGHLRVLGDGQQEKSYLYVQDCLAAIMTAVRRHDQESGAHLYNLGTKETIRVDDSVKIIIEHLAIAPEIEHTGGPRGWTGDSPLIHLDTTRIRSLGWRPQVNIEQAISYTLSWLDANEHIGGDQAGECALTNVTSSAAERRAR